MKVHAIGVGTLAAFAGIYAAALPLPPWRLTLLAICVWAATAGVRWFERAKVTR